MAKISNKELLMIIRDEFNNAENQRASVDVTRKQCISAYVGDYPEPRVQKDVSSAIVTVVQDTIQNTMPSILGVFESTPKAVNFSTRNKEDQETARNMTDYANFVFNDLNPRHNNLSTAIYNGLLCGSGFLKTYWKQKHHSSLSRL